MKGLKAVLLMLDFAVTFVISAFLILAGSYSLYALWDNRQIYAAADDVQSELLKLKPEEEKENGASFEELRKINPDVCGWLTLDHTKIDYPVLKGKDNLAYINTDVYGKFSMAGSIFLDSRCKEDFEDKYSLLYGHHMEGHQMFGDLDLYRNQTFFKENHTGKLYLPEKSYDLDILACLVVPSSEEKIFATDKWQSDTAELLLFAETEGVSVDKEKIEEIKRTGDSPRLLAMATCSSEYTDARTVLLAVMK